MSYEHEWLKPGVTEREIEAKVHELMLSRGCEIIYAIIVALAAIPAPIDARRPKKSSARAILSSSTSTRWARVGADCPPWSYTACSHDQQCSKLLSQQACLGCEVARQQHYAESEHHEGCSGLDPPDNKRCRPAFSRQETNRE
jgi:hypothetical protein